MKNLELSLVILPTVYAPSDDSYLLISALKVKKGEDVLEIGTGSGVVAIHCALAGANVTAVDINPKAVRCAKENAKANNAKIKILKSNLFSKVKGKFDKIVFNAPYLPSDKSDPHYDLYYSGGKTGVEVTNKFLKQANKFLKPKGEIYFVASSFADISKINAKYKVVKKKNFGDEIIFVCKSL